MASTCEQGKAQEHAASNACEQGKAQECAAGAQEPRSMPRLARVSKGRSRSVPLEPRLELGSVLVGVPSLPQPASLRN